MEQAFRPATSATFTFNGFFVDGDASFSWNCASAAGSHGRTDSEKLTTVQTQGSMVVGNTSGAAISGSVNGAIDGALGGTSGSGSSGTSPTIMSREEFADQIAVGAAHGRPQSGSPAQRAYDYFYKQGLLQYDAMLAKGLVAVWTGTMVSWVSQSSLNFAAERSPVVERANEAFAALGYAAVNKAPRQAPLFASQWSTWADVRGSGFEQSDSRVLKGTQINATGASPTSSVPILLWERSQATRISTTISRR